MTTTKHPIEGVLWYALPAEDAADRIGVDPDQGLSVDEAGRRLAEYGPNELPTEPPPSVDGRGRPAVEPDERANLAGRRSAL